MIKLVFLCGAGGVGKTTLLGALERELYRQNVNVEVQNSITRDVYAAQNVVDEQSALADVDFNMVLQDNILHYYCDNLVKRVQHVKDHREHGRDTTLLIDRSPFDYISYYFQAFQDRLTLAKIKAKRDIANTLIQQLYDMGQYRSYMCFMPYPMHWSQDTESSDGWRADRTGKNLCWNGLLREELCIWDNTQSDIGGMFALHHFSDYGTLESDVKIKVVQVLHNVAVLSS